MLYHHNLSQKTSTGGHRSPEGSPLQLVLRGPHPMTSLDLQQVRACTVLEQRPRSKKIVIYMLFFVSICAGEIVQDVGRNHSFLLLPIEITKISCFSSSYCYFLNGWFHYHPATNCARYFLQDYVKDTRAQKIIQFIVYYQYIIYINKND